MRGAWALTAAIATFAASRRDFSCTVRAGDHRNKEDIKAKIVVTRRRVFLEFILPATMVLALASHARAALASSSAVRRVA